MPRNIEQRPVFAVGNDEAGIPVVVIGIPKECWEYMKDGKTTHFDLTRAGFPVKVMIFGADDHNSAVRMIQDGVAAGGGIVEDGRQKDFAMRDKDGKSMDTSEPIARNCANWKDGVCDSCGVQWQGCEVSESHRCAYFQMRP